MRLKGKVAFIAAGAGGVGKDIAVVFASAGAKVAIGDRDPRVAEACARALDPTGQQVIGLGLDVTDEAQVEAATAQTADVFGTLDVLVHVVGVPALARCDDSDLLEWKRQLAIELDCAFVTTRAAVRQMRRQDCGSVVYVGSTPSTDTPGLVAPYARLRRGLTALASAVAADGDAPRVWATTIWPVRTSRATARDVAEAVTSPARAFASSAETSTDPDRVCDLTAALLPMGLCTLERVARHLGVDPRTLQRRLARHGTAFGTIIDDMRADQATHFLRETDLSLTEVSETLGFSALSAFSRWFRQRFGCSATTWRRAGRVPLRA